MTRYLLDTDTLIDFSKGIEPVTSQLLAWIDGVDVVAVCAISVAEFYAGLTAREADQASSFVRSLAYWDISTDAAMRAGKDRSTLRQSGHTVTIADALLGAVARELGATLVTSNVKDFPLEGVRLLSIR